MDGVCHQQQTNVLEPPSSSQGHEWELVSSEPGGLISALLRLFTSASIQVSIFDLTSLFMLETQLGRSSQILKPQNLKTLNPYKDRTASHVCAVFKKNVNNF